MYSCEKVLQFAIWKKVIATSILRKICLGGAESFGLSSEASAQASGESENLPRPRGCPLALIFVRLKQYFRFLVRVSLLVVFDTMVLHSSFWIGNCLDSHLFIFTLKN